MLAGVLVMAVIPALVYLLWHAGRPPQPGLAAALVKTASTALLALGGLVAGAPAAIVAGLAFGALGDFALARPGERAFLAGMAAFGAGHLAYAMAFWTGDPGPWWAVGAVLALAGSTEVWLAPRVPRPMRWPVRAYVGLIAAMGVAALCQSGSAVLAGVGLFLLSDTLLAWEKFVAGNPVRLASRAVWVCYCSGQALILWGGTTGLS
ncbi:lysoplasmalogenase [Rhodobacter sp. Har01]|uniref:lysoplasmalogenase n=1 Tax=Rhodobacter sp. Har01 TaxID=2883999 RepID=UPI001D07EF55|nr:lysoplasmalogenase [Rhodobacter sp. Har01]MCB6178661.1 lysoplasmalogenase [Rhodobacter sp. Har01]